MGPPAAHPRSRGENLKDAGRLVIGGGSSPLTRGKRGCFPGCWVSAGLIPAHAGKTPARGRAYGSPWAHPRSRGENLTEFTHYSSATGSSPLTRGKQPRSLNQGLTRGLIPAHAGKTLVAMFFTFLSWAHPRSRGENLADFNGFIKPEGSSPLTRGKPEEPHRAVRDRGLIPAHAGKTEL